MKLCRDCGTKKELSDFSLHPTSKGGYRPFCKICARVYDKKYYISKKIQRNKMEAKCQILKTR